MENINREKQWIEEIIETIEWNKKFIEENTIDCYKVFAEFMEDVIKFQDKFSVFGELRNRLNDAFEPPAKDIGDMKAMVWFATHVLPLARTLSVYLQLGSPLGCIAILRFMLETLGRCYFARTVNDVTAGKIKYKKRRKVGNITNLMSLLDEELGTNDIAKKLWMDLSNKWIHSGAKIGEGKLSKQDYRGFAERFKELLKETLKNEKAISPWLFLGFGRYYEQDKKIIEEICEYVSKFRVILNAVRLKRKGV